MIVVLCPSRGRPENARRLITSWFDTTETTGASLIIGVDGDDETRADYHAVVREQGHRRRFGYGDVLVVTLWAEETGNLTRALNGMWARFEAAGDIIGTVNDDMAFRTPGWDAKVRAAGAPVVYGDDGFQHEALVTTPFMQRWVPEALGWYALPALQHQFIDNVWGDLARGIGGPTYLPDVCIEHLHPFADKAEWDATYEKGNAQPVIDADRTAYEAWRDGQGRARDILALRAARP